MYSSAFSVGKRRDREWCYQRIANNGLCNCTSSDDYRTRTWPKSWQQKDISFPIVSKQTVSMGYDQEIQDAWNPLSSSRKWMPLQANAQDLGHRRGTNACGRRDSSSPASQDRERCGVQRHQEYNCSSTENSRHQLTINRYRLTDNHYVLTEIFTDKPRQIGEKH